jgi:hypothetical protein
MAMIPGTTPLAAADSNGEFHYHRTFFRTWNAQDHRVSIFLKSQKPFTQLQFARCLVTEFKQNFCHLLPSNSKKQKINTNKD